MSDLLPVLRSQPQSSADGYSQPSQPCYMSFHQPPGNLVTLATFDPPPGSSVQVQAPQRPPSSRPPSRTPSLAPSQAAKSPSLSGGRRSLQHARIPGVHNGQRRRTPSLTPSTLADTPTSNGAPPRVVTCSQVVNTQCPVGLEYLIQVEQLFVHQKILKIADWVKPRSRFEIMNTAKQMVFMAEEDPKPYGSEAYTFRVFNGFRHQVMEIVSTGVKTCLCWGTSIHSCSSLHFEVCVMAPLGNIVGYVRRKHTWCMQEFELVNADEEILLLMSGFPNDLTIYSPDNKTEVGMIAKRWTGSVKDKFTSSDDFIITFPWDMDVRVKALIIGAMLMVEKMYFDRR